MLLSHHKSIKLQAKVNSCHYWVDFNAAISAMAKNPNVKKQINIVVKIDKPIQ